MAERLTERALTKDQELIGNRFSFRVFLWKLNGHGRITPNFEKVPECMIGVSVGKEREVKW